MVSLQREGTFSFRKAWYHHTYDESQDLIVQHHELPEPVVADLNGDGSLEVVAATSDLRIEVFEPGAHGRAGEGFGPARIIQQVSLLHKQALVAAGRRPVALGVGLLDPPPSEAGVRPLRKQVIIVVTASWEVLAYDHNLRLLWEKDVAANFPHHAHLKEVAVYISSHRVHQEDRGLVVVGASMERGDLASGEGLEGAGHEAGTNGTQRFFDDDDVLLEELRSETEAKRHMRSAGMAETLSDIDAGGARGVGGLSRHFSYVALEGGSGEERWHHGSTDFHKDLTVLAGETTPQNNYRLDAERMEGRHFGEASCREYRESVLHVLPHVWDRPTDTRLEEAHFVRHREGRGAQRRALNALGQKRGAKHAGAGSRGTARASHHSSLHTHAALHPPGHPPGLGGVLSGRGKGPRHASSAPTEGGGSRPHGRGGMHAHLHADPHGAPGGHGNNSANALVAYLEEGIEVLHLYTGRTICKLHLPPGVLHADINGDGVLDHVMVHHGPLDEGDREEPGQLHVVGRKGHRRRGHCHAIATSGIPPMEQAWEVQVCRPHQGLARGAEVLRRSADDTPSQVLTPVFLPVPDLAHGYRSHRKQHGIVVFATSVGEMTAVNAKGSVLWTDSFPIMWDTQQERSVDFVVPTLSAMALRKHAVPSAILAAGSTAAVMVSEHGHTLEQLELPYPPVQPLSVVDFNGDGLNDIILVTANGMYGYAQVQHLGGLTLSALLLTLLLALGVVYFTQVSDVQGTLGRARKLRSTEFTD